MRLPETHALRNFTALAAAGAFLGGCAMSGGETNEQTPPSGSTEAYRCSAHLYPPNDIIEVDVRTQQSPFTHIDAQRIRVQLPNGRPHTKPAAHNRADFAIPKDYSQIFVQAVAAGQRIACTTIYRPSYDDLSEQ